MKYVIAADIGGTNIRVGIVDENYKVEQFAKIPRKQIMSGERPAEGLVQFFRDFIKNEAAGKEIAAVTVGVPAPVDKYKKIVLSTPNIPNFDMVPLVDILSEGLGIPAYLDRDVCLLFHRDMAYNNVPDEGIAAGFYIGTGIGNVFSFNGELVAGKNGAAGELGHIAVMGEHGPCGCGNEGCVELFAGGKVLAEIMERKYPETPVSDAFVRHADDPEILEFLDNVAVVITTELNILDPDYIILGGGVIGMKEFPRDVLEKLIYKHARKPYPAETLSFIYSDDADVNGVLGGGILAHKKLNA